VIRPSALRVKRRDVPWLMGMGVLAVGVFQVLWILAVLINGVSVSTVIPVQRADHRHAPGLRLLA